MIQNDKEDTISIFGRNLSLWRSVFCLLLSVYALVIVFTLTDYGLTVDEPPLLNYGRDILTWYQSGFEYQDIFETTNTWLYGGIVHVAGYVFAETLPLETYDAYHLVSVLIGFLGVVAAYRLGCFLGGGPAGVFAALFLILTPRYYGHAFNNPKDIPFAVFYLWSVYWIARDVGKLPDLPRNWIWKTGLAIGLTLACRVNGVILFAYLGLFFGLRYLEFARQRQDLLSLVCSFARQVLPIVAVAWVVMLPFWPWGLLNPLTGPFRAIGYFSQFIEPHYSFFNGQYMANTEIPWYYVSKWLLLTLPEFVLLGLIVNVVLLRSYLNLQYGLVAFAGLFPIVYAAVMQTPFYDGYRHALFVVPPLVVMSAVGIVNFVDRLQIVSVRRIAAVITGGLAVWTLVYMIRIHPNQNVYFNHLIAGGIEEASARYETDYWGNSYKQGFEWIEANYEWDFGKRKLKVASFFGQLHNVMKPEFFERIEEFEQADLILGTTRFDHHRIVPGEIVHTIEADHTPILYIIRPDPQYSSIPFFADSPFRRIYLDLNFQDQQSENERQDFLDRVKQYNLESFVAGSYNNQALDYHQSGDYDKAIALYNDALVFHPDHLITWYNLAQTYHVGGYVHQAVAAYEKALALNGARIMDAKAVRTLYYNLGECYHRIGKLDQAEKHYQHALERDFGALDILNNLAGIYIQQERFGEASEILQPLVGRYPKRSDLRLNFALALANMNRVEEALVHTLEVLKGDPQNTRALELVEVLRGEIAPE